VHSCVGYSDRVPLFDDRDEFPRFLDPVIDVRRSPLDVVGCGGRGLWRAGQRWPFTLRVSSAAIGVQVVVAVVIAVLHLGLLQLAAHWIAQAAPEMDRPAYSGLEFFNVWRFGIELLVYGFIWSACAAFNTQLAAQKDAMHSLELERPAFERPFARPADAA